MMDQRCSSTPPSFASSSCLPVLVVFWFASSVLFIHGTRAQNSNTTTTDPVEVAALNSIFEKWKISSSKSFYKWNTTGDPCSGYAITADDKMRDDDVNFNPAILCDCTFNNDSTCHIIRLKAYDLNIVSTIPDELQNLPYLDNLQIGKNYLTGPLPAFIGNFSKMKYLSVGLNSLSGPLPKELGNLQNLISLGLGSRNNFSGPLPPQLGNLTNLEQMYVDSNGLSGEIPPTLVKLQKLKIMWASDNNFGGKMPDFIGNMTRLESLRLQGNSFQGPIPSSFANLNRMTDLQLSDLSNGTSSLSFISNMKSLATLVLRDCKIGDSISSNIGDYHLLVYMDLSFNNITGTLPPSLFNIDSLQTLHLGNNSISGNLPEQKSSTLLNLDLSYNQLSGGFPSWVSDSNLRLNLVSNNFIIDDSNDIFPFGLRCLQRNIPCYRGSPNYYSFAINCGGTESVQSNGVEYEMDNQDLSTASYYVTSTTRWAVSSVGTFVDAQIANYTVNSLSDIANTSNPKLFQAARLSPSSLRYYGLGLENGNYTVTLQFAEIIFPDDLTWHSFGKRIFDIYIQGKLVVKDFDIRKVAGMKSFKAIKKEYTTLVTDNFLEVHLFWAGKGTCCIPVHGSYGPLISALSITPNFKPTVSNRPPKTSRNENKTALIVGVTVGIVALFSLLIIGIFLWRKKKKHPYMDEDEELIGLTIIPNSFSYLELKTATEDFSRTNKLGEGGFGPVFKGKLADGKVIAVKQLSVPSLHGKRQFVTEIATISAVKHRNLVSLLGCCYEGDNRLLVYEYLENNSLDHALFGRSGLQLDWPARFMICLGTARGLAYLHEEARVRIIHRDIKASNILLDGDLNPKISDFGLAKLYDEKMTHISTRVAGTVGYLAPEYAMRGHLTEKADIFGFGIVALEILCGRPNTDSRLDEEKMYLLEWAWQLHENGRGFEMLDPKLSLFNKEEVVRMIGVAFLCTQVNPMVRPPMSRVVAMLVGDVEVGDIPSKPAYLTDWEFDEFNSKMGITLDSSSGVPSSYAPFSTQTTIVDGEER